MRPRLAECALVVVSFLGRRWRGIEGKYHRQSAMSQGEGCLAFRWFRPNLQSGRSLFPTGAGLGSLLIRADHRSPYPRDMFLMDGVGLFRLHEDEAVCLSPTSTCKSIASHQYQHHRCRWPPRCGEGRTGADRLSRRSIRVAFAGLHQMRRSLSYALGSGFRPRHSMA
ncbi:hypothetical protein LZ32DRAFT_388274 [Colletotrichum eremochloae]|nr:hypothetical protein LZ32DRAFT_388274 [Colletotrichum eremochloae]